MMAAIEFVQLLKRNRLAVSVILAAALAACSSGLESKSGKIRSSESLELEVPGARLIVPAGELPDGLRVILSVQEFEAGSGPPDITSDMALTPIVSASFDTTEPVVGDFTFEIALPESASDNIYVLQRSRGGLLTDGITDTGWLLGFGDVDKRHSVMNVRLAATAENISIVVVDVGAQPVSLQQTLQPPAKYIVTSVGTMLGISEANAEERDSPSGPNVEFLTSRGWVVFCQAETLSNPNSCSLTNIQLDALAKLAVESSQVLDDLGFSFSYLRVLDRDAITTSRFQYALAESESTARIPDEYFVLVFAKNLGDAGVYDAASGVPYISSDVRRTTIHEILHAVQFASTRYMYPRNWFIEGTAAAIETLAPGFSDPGGAEHGYQGEARDWSVELSENGRPASYQTSEFWRSIDGSLSYLPDLYAKLDAATPNPVTGVPRKTMNLSIRYCVAE